MSRERLREHITNLNEQAQLDMMCNGGIVHEMIPTTDEYIDQFGTVYDFELQLAITEFFEQYFRFNDRKMYYLDYQEGLLTSKTTLIQYEWLLKEFPTFCDEYGNSYFGTRMPFDTPREKWTTSKFVPYDQQYQR